MSFQARLVLGSNEYNVLECDFDVHQPVGRHNLPNHHTEVGLINLVVESGSSNELLDWGLSTMTKNGSVVFYRRDAVAPLKTLEFEQAFCIKYRELFNHEGSIPMRIQMTISPFVIRMQGVGLSQPWAGFRVSNNNGDQSTTTSPQASDRQEERQNSSVANDNSPGNTVTPPSREAAASPPAEETPLGDIPSFRP
ncbi:MAG TPA: type VI secretion system tube protein TssD [Flavipsychrobacter sp.]|nr:type VI secretion system tube protein TssD [Flavipsychrobacter sp.]